MVLLSLNQITKSFAMNRVLTGVDLVLQEGQRMGLVGVNGCGKSTLFKIISGDMEPDGGEISIKRGTTVGVLTQTADIEGDLTLRQELERVFEPVRRMEEKLREMEQRMGDAGGSELEKLADEYARLTDRYEDAGGYEWPSRIQGVLAGLGFAKGRENDLARDLSGGEKTRLCLARLLLISPDLLMLDEPTNHLDLASSQWLEDTLKKYRGTILVISHDRYFLNAVCDNMAELMNGTMSQYEGNYDRFLVRRTQEMERRVKEYRMQQQEIARQQAIIDRYRMYNREKSIRAAESREKRLEKMEKLERPVSEQKVRFSFSARRRTGEDVVIADGLTKSFGDRTLFSGVSFKLRAGDRVALIGPNGVGKTTLLNMVTGGTAGGGVVRFGSNVDMGYYDQHQSRLDPGKDVLHEVWDDFPRLEHDQVRGALALFLLTGDDVFQKIGTLSGGEKGRVALAKLMLRRDNLLLLDEPTNHLDMDSREVLEGALEDFEGTILTVSHDRYFINRVANRVFELTDEGITEYIGNYDDYLDRKRREREGAEEEETGGATRTRIEKMRRKMREAEKSEAARKQYIAELEEGISRMEEQIRELEASMGDPRVYTDPDESARVARRARDAKLELGEMYEEWSGIAE